MEKSTDSDSDSHDNSVTSLPEPKLQTTPVVYKGKMNCCICFSVSDKKNKRRDGLQRINDVETFRKFAAKWEEYDYEFNKIYKKN